MICSKNFRGSFTQFWACCGWHFTHILFYFILDTFTVKSRSTMKVHLLVKLQVCSPRNQAALNLSWKRISPFICTSVRHHMVMLQLFLMSESFYFQPSAIEYSVSPARIQGAPTAHAHSLFVKNIWNWLWNLDTWKTSLNWLWILMWSMPGHPHFHWPRICLRIIYIVTCIHTYSWPWSVNGYQHTMKEEWCS
jgi:hypothetical protein